MEEAAAARPRVVGGRKPPGSDRVAGRAAKPLKTTWRSPGRADRGNRSIAVCETAGSFDKQGRAADRPEGRRPIRSYQARARAWTKAPPGGRQLDQLEHPLRQAPPPAGEGRGWRFSDPILDWDQRGRASVRARVGRKRPATALRTHAPARTKGVLREPWLGRQTNGFRQLEEYEHARTF